MDERAVRKLRAAAEYARREADRTAEAVTRMEVKVDRARIAHEAAEGALDTARLEASDAEQMAEQAAAAAESLPGYGGFDGPTVYAQAGTAAASGEAGGV